MCHLVVHNSEKKKSLNSSFFFYIELSFNQIDGNAFSNFSVTLFSYKEASKYPGGFWAEDLFQNLVDNLLWLVLHDPKVITKKWNSRELEPI